MAKYAFILSGGGFKGAYQVGALKALQEAGIVPSFVAGVSVGALNGSFVAMNKYNKLIDFWAAVSKNGPSEIYTSDYISTVDGKMVANTDKIVASLLPKLNLGLLVKLVFSKKALKELIGQVAEKMLAIKAVADNAPLLAKLKQEVQRDAFIIPFGAGFVSLQDGNYYCVGPDDVDSDEELAKAIFASASLPIVWPQIPSIKLKTKTVYELVDGGVRNISPLKDAVDFVKRQPDLDDWKFVIINCSNGTLEETSTTYSITSTALRVVNDISTSETFLNDMSTFIGYNNSVGEDGSAKVIKGEVRHFFPYEIMQPFAHELGDTLDSTPASIASRMALGYDQMQKLLPSIKAL